MMKPKFFSQFQVYLKPLLLVGDPTSSTIDCRR